MCEFKYKIDEDWRAKVLFDSLRDKALTKCKIKLYYRDELMYNGLGIAFCMPEDTWDDAEGRKWAFINAIKNTLPKKSQSEVRKALQKEYVKWEKKWAEEEKVITYTVTLTTKFKGDENGKKI